MNLTAKRRTVRVGLLLAAFTLLCYWPLASNKFINVDDPQYILKNPNVNSGLSWSGVAWAFQAGYACNWHPLTWISHMLDCSFYGLNPAGHHLTSLLFHVANTLLLFGLLKRMTGAFWRSTLVAAFFAWHPVHVESVAWASERKDVLSTFFFLLTLLAYVRYVQESKMPAMGAGDACQVPGTEHRTQSTPRATRWRALSLALFALGLMCKPMLVTLPFVLLLLDFWPLQRMCSASSLEVSPLSVRRSMFDGRSLGPLLGEKLPFFALSIASSAITFLVQQNGGAVSGLSAVSPYLRVGNALLGYVRYLGKTFWPANLAPMYPLPDTLPIFAVAGAALLLAGVSALAVRRAGTHAYLLTGWFWYLGTLVPAIGLVQVGPQAMADRYLYIPSIGLFLLVVWGVAEMLSKGSKGLTELTGLNWLNRNATFFCLGVSPLVACLLCTCYQAQYWHDGETLYRHSLQATGPNYVACDYLGIALQESGKTEEALSLLAQSVQLAPRYGESRYNLGTMLLDMGRLDEAVGHLRTAIQVAPADGNAHHNLGNAYLKRKQLPEATTELARAAALKPDDAAVRLTLGSVLLEQRRLEEAVVLLSDALRLAPNNVEAHRNLGVALAREGKVEEARRQFAEAVRLDAKDPELRFQLGLSLLDLGRPEEAAVQFATGLQRNPKDAKTQYRLAVALSRQHKTEEAILHFREALRLHPDFPEARSELALALASDTNPKE